MWVQRPRVRGAAATELGVRSTGGRLWIGIRGLQVKIGSWEEGLQKQDKGGLFLRIPPSALRFLWPISFRVGQSGPYAE